MGGRIQRKVFLTVPQRLVKEPILYNLGKNFAVVPNIRGASVTDEIALLALLLEGEAGEVARAVEYLERAGVKVENLEEEEEE